MEQDTQAQAQAQAQAQEGMGTELSGSEAVTGYRTRVWTRTAFVVRGYTLVVPPGRAAELIPRFWEDTAADGRLAQLASCSRVRPWMLGLGSWDPACEKGGQRYTICIEESARTDFRALEARHPLFRKEIGASDWLCFELTPRQLQEQFWRDNPYEMMKRLGFRFHMGGAGDYSVGLHFDAYPPGLDDASHDRMEFWITVQRTG